MDIAHQAPNKWCPSLNADNNHRSNEGGTNGAKRQKEEQSKLTPSDMKGKLFGFLLC